MPGKVRRLRNTRIWQVGVPRGEVRVGPVRMGLWWRSRPCGVERTRTHRRTAASWVEGVHWVVPDSRRNARLVWPPAPSPLRLFPLGRQQPGANALDLLPLRLPLLPLRAERSGASRADLFPLARRHVLLPRAETALAPRHELALRVVADRAHLPARDLAAHVAAKLAVLRAEVALQVVVHVAPHVILHVRRLRDLRVDELGSALDPPQVLHAQKRQHRVDGLGRKILEPRRHQPVNQRKNDAVENLLPCYFLRHGFV
mmetsp:Transcript_18603/g.46437  ORF Transcript_18603/g.46437 Transcript_18603/m.46437 type:complete len:258 (-) Transcript_18603:998-1771(-)